MKPPTIAPPGFDLEEPGTLLFTPERALRGHVLNQCALSLKHADNRQAFVQDPRDYMKRHGLDETLRETVMRRDWVALQRDGGHLQAILKIAAALGESLWHIGACHVGVSAEELMAICPRIVHGMPQELSSWPA